MGCYPIATDINLDVCLVKSKCEDCQKEGILDLLITLISLQTKWIAVD